MFKIQFTVVENFCGSEFPLTSGSHFPGSNMVRYAKWPVIDRF